MPSPSSSLATTRPDLAGSLMEFDLAASRAGFIATQVCPVTEVAKPVGKYGKIPVEQLLKARTTARAPGAGYNRGEWTFTTASFNCLEYGAEEPIDDAEATIYNDYFDAEVISASRALDGVLREMEKRVAALIFNATTWTSNTTAIDNEWDDFTNAVPIKDVHAAVLNVWAASGIWPNALIINRKVFKNLRLCDQIRDRIASTGAGDSVLQGRITAQQLAQAFDLERIIIGGEPKDSALEGQDTTVAAIWSDEYAMVGKVASSGDIREPCIGRLFHYAEDGSSIGGTVETYRDEPVRADIVRVRNDVDEIVPYMETGWLLSNATTI